MIELPVRNFKEDADRPWRFGVCEVCPLNPPHVVRGWGSTKSGISIVGESPGQVEVQKGRPFIGPSGQLIRTILSRLGQDPDECYWTNALLCHAASPEKNSIVACNQRLHEELFDAGTKKVLLLGGKALQALVSPKIVQGIIKGRGKGFWVRINGIPTYGMATFHPAFVLRDTDLFRDIVFDVEKFLANNTPIEPPKPHVFVSWTADQAARRLPPLLAASRISCDIETTGFSPISDLILSVGFGVERANGEHEVQIIPNHILESEEVSPIVKKFFTEYKGQLIFQNGKFDLRMLSHFYKESLHPINFQDTLLAHYSIDERASGGDTAQSRTRKIKRHGLKTLARLYLDADDYAFDFEDFFAIEKPTKEDYERLFYYQGLDCAYTLQLWNLFEPQLDDSAKRLLSNLLYPASFVFQDIENGGVGIDTEYLRGLEISVERDIQQIGEAVGKLVAASSGIDDWRTETQKRKISSDPEPFNPGSSQQVKKLIYTHWKIPQQHSMSHMAKQRRREGKDYWPTDHVTLARIAEKINDPVRQSILLAIVEWRKKRILQTTNIVGLLQVTDIDGRVRPNFLLHGTVTGRLSCTSPNLQNIPVRAGNTIHTAFRPRSGWCTIEADYSQLEVRVLAEFSQDPTLIHDCSTSDIHGGIASRTFNKPPEEITVFERILTKNMVFGTFYGRSPAGILAGEEMVELVKRGMKRWTEDEAASFIRRLLNLYPGLDNYFKQAKHDAITDHAVAYSLGRRRRFPFITNTNRDEILRQAVNSPVQGTASDICLHALIRLHKRLQGQDIHIVSTVHDEILFECRDDLLSTFLPVIKETMEDVQLFKPTVPYKVKIKVGPDWGHTEEVMV